LPASKREGILAIIIQSNVRVFAAFREAAMYPHPPEFGLLRLLSEALRAGVFIGEVGW
jgi:hypothetical protein